MGILGIDIGSSTIKIIEYEDEKILSKGIFEGKDYEKIIDDFISGNNIEQIDRIVLTGINSKKIDVSKYSVPVEVVEEFNAVATGGLYLAKKDKAIIASIGTGTALIRAEGKEFKHLGGTGVGAGTLTNLCKKFANTKSFEEIIELSKQGDLSNIDLRIADLTDENIETLPPELTLANFGKLSEGASKSDIVIGLINMVFEIIGMMTAFASINDNIKDIVLIGNIVSIPVVKDVLRKIEKTHKISFIVPEEPQFAVAIGAIQALD
jgi:type II pantothenate kinase